MGEVFAAAVYAGGSAVERELCALEQETQPPSGICVSDWRGPRRYVKLRLMAKPAIDISALTPDERLSLIGELWDSLDDLPAALSTEQSEELARRVERVRRDGPSGTTISEIRGRLLGS